jgi:hypothetical protein
MTVTERIVRDWLIRRGYKEHEIVFNRKGSPDFILPDRRVEVKRPVSGYLWFTPKQLEELADDDEVFVVHEGRPDRVSSVKFSEIRGKRTVTVGGETLRITVGPVNERIVIRCSPQTKAAFAAFITSYNYRSAEEALRALLEQAGVLKPARVF